MARSLAIERSGSPSARFKTWFLGKDGGDETLAHGAFCGLKGALGRALSRAQTEPQPPRPMQWYPSLDICSGAVVVDLPSGTMQA